MSQIGKEKVDELIAFLAMKYDARLRQYEGIKSDAPMREGGYDDTSWNPPAHSVFRNTAGANRLRVLKGAIDILKGETPQYIGINEVYEVLRDEKNIIYKFGVRFRASYQMYNEVIDYLISIKKN